MKSACKSLKTSILISILFFILAIVLFIYNIKIESNIVDFMNNIIIGIFSSSIVALMLNIPAYIVAKRQLLEKIWEEARQLSSCAHKIDFFYLEFDEKDYINYLNECKNNRWKIEYNKLIINDKSATKGNLSKKMQIENKYKNVILKKYKSGQLELKKKLSEKEYGKIIDELFEETNDKIIKNMDIIIKQYIELSKESTSKLNFLLGDLEFLMGKGNYKKIHNRIYKPLYDMLNCIKEQTFHFKSYINGEGNQCVVLEKLLNLQKTIFNVKKSDGINKYDTIIYNTFVDNMLIDLEELRAYMYGIKKENIDTFPIKAIANNIYQTKEKIFDKSKSL